MLMAQDAPWTNRRALFLLGLLFRVDFTKHIHTHAAFRQRPMVPRPTAVGRDGDRGLEAARNAHRDKLAVARVERRQAIVVGKLFVAAPIMFRNGYLHAPFWRPHVPPKPEEKLVSR